MNNPEQGSEEWFRLRLGKVTASRVADLSAKVARKTYMMELLTERLTGQLTSSLRGSASTTFAGRADLERGVALEPVARALYELHTGEFVSPASFILHPKIANTGASPDGLLGTDGLLEIKCPRPHNHTATLVDNSVPSKYLPQITWQIACTGRRWVDFVSYCAEMPPKIALKVIRYIPDPVYLKGLEESVTMFLQELEAELATLTSSNGDKSWHQA